MKITKLTLCVVMLLSLFTSCKKEKHEKHIIMSLQPNGDIGKDAVFSKIIPEKNVGDIEDIHLYAWTNGGILNINRVAIDFDIESISSEAQIDSAFLSLYFNYNSVYGSEHEGENGFVIQRITSDWEESTITWNSQPITTNIHEVYVSSSISATQDFINIDITDLIQDILLDKEHSYGLLLKLINEEPYRKLLLASSDHEEETIRPKLVVYYTITE